jgi:hypothetical protein
VATGLTSAEITCHEARVLAGQRRTAGRAGRKTPATPGRHGRLLHARSTKCCTIPNLPTKNRLPRGPSRGRGRAMVVATAPPWIVLRRNTRKSTGEKQERSRHQTCMAGTTISAACRPPCTPDPGRAGRGRDTCHCRQSVIFWARARATSQSTLKNKRRISRLIPKISDRSTRSSKETLTCHQ